MMNKINAKLWIECLLMTLDEKGYIVERVMDDFVQVFDKSGKLILTGDFESAQPYEEFLAKVGAMR